MSGLKKNRYLLAAALAVVCLAGCADSKESAVISSELVSEESGFGHDEARKGDFVDTLVLEAEQVYPISNMITSAYNGVRLKEIHVKAGQAVQAGELLATIEPVTDEMLSEKEAVIAKNREDADKVLAGYQASMGNIRQNVAQTAGTQQKIHQIELEKVQRQYEWYAQDADKTQQELRTELEQLRSLPKDLNIYAPYDGVVDSVSNVPGGTELTVERELMRIHSEEQILLKISKGSQLRYGQEVTVETGSGENIKSYKGTVISADNVRSDAFKDGSAVVRIEDEVVPEELKNMRVKASARELHNVLVVKEYAVNTEKDKNYVSILEGDKMMKRRVITGGSCGGYTWILQGLDEGQSVTIQ